MTRVHPAYILLGLAALAGAGLAQAQTAATPAPSLAQIVLARQASLEMSGVTFIQMKHAMESAEQAKNESSAANALALWAKTLPAMFPAGTAIGQTSITSKAKPEIWTNRPQFESRAADYAAATAKLSDLAKADDAAGFTAQLDAVRKTCSACHEDFKAR
jgi:cytochrome c556